MQCLLRQITQALMFLNRQNRQNFSLNSFNVDFAEMFLLLSWIFRIINFEIGCLSFDKIGDFVSCKMGASFKHPLHRKAPSSSSFAFKSSNVELLSLKPVKWNSNCLAFTKSFAASFNSFIFKIGSPIVFCVLNLLRL